MKLICDKIGEDCNCCPHSIPHDNSDECNEKCPDVHDSKCVSEIKHKRKEKLEKLYETR